MAANQGDCQIDDREAQSPDYSADDNAPHIDDLESRDLAGHPVHTSSEIAILLPKISIATRQRQVHNRPPFTRLDLLLNCRPRHSPEGLQMWNWEALEREEGWQATKTICLVV